MPLTSKENPNVKHPADEEVNRVDTGREKGKMAGQGGVCCWPGYQRCRSVAQQYYVNLITYVHGRVSIRAICSQKFLFHVLKEVNIICWEGDLCAAHSLIHCVY